MRMVMAVVRMGVVVVFFRVGPSFRLSLRGFRLSFPGFRLSLRGFSRAFDGLAFRRLALDCLGLKCPLF